MIDFEKVANKISSLDRAIVSDGYSEALNYLADLVPMKIHEIPSGTPAWTWITPDKWTVEEAYFMNGSKKYADYKEHPLHLLSYSSPFQGRMSKNELLKHIYTDEKYPDAIPFKYSYYKRKWGFCLPHNMLEELVDSHYNVVIKTKFEKDFLKIGEYIKKGISDDTIVFMGHLCHPAQFNDGLSGVLVNVAISEYLESLGPTYYTYRILAFSEVIGSTVYLSQNEELIPKIKGAVFLEMLACNQNFSLQHSYQKIDYIDKVAQKVFKDMHIKVREGNFLKVIRNDEKIFNAPGVMIPSISISRSKFPGEDGFPFPGYHTSIDNPENASFSKLYESYSVITRFIDYLEKDFFPKRTFKGQVMLSKFNLWVEPSENRDLYNKLEMLMWNLEGDKSVLEIALELDIEFYWLNNYLNQYFKNKLIKKNYKRLERK